MLSFLFPLISILCVRSTHPPLFSPLLPLPPNSLFTIPSLLSGILSSTAMHPRAPTLWPRMTFTLHLTYGNLLTKDFCFSFPLFSYFLISSLCSSPLTSHPSLFGFCLFLISFPVKWAYQVPRYVSDAAPHVPTLRFGKEMSSKSRLQGRPPSSSTFYPVLNNLSSTGVNSSQCLCSAVLPCFFTLLLLVFWYILV